MVRIHIAVFCIISSTLVGRYQPSGWIHCLLLQEILEAAHSSDERLILTYGTVVQQMDLKPQKVCLIWLEILFHPIFWDLFSLCYVTILSLLLSLSLSSTDHHFAVHTFPKTQQTLKLQYAVKPPTVTKIWQCRYSSNIVLSLLEMGWVCEEEHSARIPLACCRFIPCNVHDVTIQCTILQRELKFNISVAHMGLREKYFWFPYHRLTLFWEMHLVPILGSHCE